MLIFLSGLKYRGREIGLIRRIREMLCFEAEAVSKAVDSPTFSDVTSIEEISGIELHARLGCIEVHDSSGGWFIDAAY